MSMACENVNSLGI